MIMTIQYLTCLMQTLIAEYVISVHCVHQPIVFLLPSEDAQQMAGFVNGSYRLLVNRNRTLMTDTNFCLPDYTRKEGILSHMFIAATHLINQLLSSHREQAGCSRFPWKVIGLYMYFKFIGYFKCKIMITNSPDNSFFTP